MLYSELCEVYEALGKTTKGLEKTAILSEFLKKLKHEKNKEILYLLEGKIFPDYDERETGISTQLAIRALGKASGVNEADIVKKWKSVGDLGEVAEEIVKRKKQHTLTRHELTTEKVLENLRKLVEFTGKGTVDKKIGLISELLSYARPLEAKYLMRTLLADLRIGVGEGILRDSIVLACFPEKTEKEIERVQESYDKSSDFALVFDLACKNKLEDSELEPGKPVKVMLYPKANSIEDAFKVTGKPAACFPEGELMFCNPSPKKIESLKQGDLIIGSSGKFQKILKTFTRDYNGDLIKIFPHYLFPFAITPEHRVISISGETCSWKTRKITCKPNCQEQKYGCKRNYRDYKPEWVEARSLKEGDFLLFPKFKESKEIEKIDLMDFNREMNIDIEVDKIRSNSELKGTFKGKKINRFIKLSDEFFELMGWYLAEGSFDRSGIKFSLGYKEEKEAERIKELIKIIFNIDAKISKRKTVIDVRAFSVLLPAFFKNSFENYPTDKKIPNFIMYSKENHIKKFILSYIQGDGHKTKNDIYIIATASKNIAHQLLLLLSKINILPSVGKYKNKGFGDIIYRVVIFGKQIDNLEKNSHKTKTNHQRFFEDDNFFYVPIRELSTETYNGRVFNLETEDNTYLSSVIVHNCEYKYDGFRMLINKTEKGEIKIFTRRLDEVTKQFPEVRDYIKKYVKGKSFILDGEAVGYDKKTKKYTPFQGISQRIRRKYDIEKVQKELPVEINLFDIIYYDGKDLLKTPFIERRKLLEKITKEKKFELVLAKQLITDNTKKAEEFYKKALEEGEEGIMVKNLNAPYKPGRRVGYGVKVKPSENDLDLVIVKAEYGTGKRGGWLTSYTIACRDNGKFLEIGKVSTGLKEINKENPEEGSLSFIDMTKKLKKLIIEEKGREVAVKPEIVVTVTYQNIQKSPSYSSGFALRFPRFTRLRPDRSVKDIASLEEIKRDYARSFSYKYG